MPESANLKTAKPKTANPSSASARVPAATSASTAGPSLTVSPPVKATTPPARAPFSTGSPLLDSFVSSSAEETVYIPNPHITGDRLGPGQGPSFRNVTLNSPDSPPPRTRFDSEDFKRTGLASASAPIKKSSKAIQLKSQPPHRPSAQPPETDQQHRQSNDPTAATTQTADTQTVHTQTADTQTANNQEQPLPASSNPQSLKQPSTTQPKGKKITEKLGQQPHQPTAPQSVEKSAAGKSAHQKSAGPTSAKANQRPQSSTTGKQGSVPISRRPPISRQNGARPAAAPSTFKSAGAPGPRVYGGSDYKALQSRAAAGGLVDLEDTLLFGGAEDKSSPLSIGNAPPGADNHSMVVLEYLLTLPSDFVLTKPEGNRAILDDFSWLERPAFIPTQAVIDARKFEVVEKPSPQTQTVQPRNAQSPHSESAELTALTQKIDQLHQRIEYLSKRLASLDADPSADNTAISHAEIFDRADMDQPQGSALFQAPSVT